MADQEKLKRMFDEGKLTAEEYSKLCASLERQEERQKDFERQASVRTKLDKKRGWFWMLFLVLSLFVGLLMGSLISYSPTQELASKEAKTEMSSENSGQPIYLNQLETEREKTMSSAKILSIPLFLLIIVCLSGIWLFSMFNKLVDSRELTNGSWAQVENVYQRRLDLVPLLVESVSKYMDHEKEVLTKITEARAKAAGVTSAFAGKAPAEAAQLKSLETAHGDLTSAIGKLFAVVENYPDLKSSSNFLALQDQLEGTENRIAVERRTYNEAVREHNARTQRFPSHIVAALFDFETKAYFQADKEALKAPNKLF